MHSDLKHDPDALCERFYSKAKLAWNCALICKLIVIIIGVTTIWLSLFSQVLPFVIFTVGIVSEWFLFRSDRDKSTAEALRRKLDLRHSLDWDISKADISDIFARAPKLKKAIPAAGNSEPYFANNEENRAVRAIKNVQESAWWNKHLSEKMGRYTLLVTLVAVVGSFGLLIVSIGSVDNFDTLSSIGRVVTAVLTMIVSIGLIRLTLAYYNLNAKSQKIEDRASQLLCNECKELDAIKLYMDFHLDRAGAPLLPDFVYKRSRAHLNEVWKDYRSDG